METFITVLLISLFFLPTILLVIQNTRQKIEIEKLNTKINRLKAEKESLMENIRALCSRIDSGKKNLHDMFYKN
jgi:cell division protein FtsB